MDDKLVYRGRTFRASDQSLRSASATQEDSLTAESLAVDTLTAVVDDYFITPRVLAVQGLLAAAGGLPCYAAAETPVLSPNDYGDAVEYFRGDSLLLKHYLEKPRPVKRQVKRGVLLIKIQQAHQEVIRAPALPFPPEPPNSGKPFALLAEHILLAVKIAVKRGPAHAGPFRQGAHRNAAELLFTYHRQQGLENPLSHIAVLFPVIHGPKQIPPKCLICAGTIDSPRI